MKIKSIKQVKILRGKTVFLRADFNVPMKNGKIQEDYKIKASLETIEYLLKKKAKIIIATHFKKPEVNSNGVVKNRKDYSVKIIADYLNKLVGKKYKVIFVNDLIGEKAKKAVSKQADNEIIMLENLRFNLGEKANNSFFAKKLAKLADIYVNNAFGVSHRKHASLVAIKKYLPSYAGLLLVEEVESLERVMNPKKPLIIIAGGAKMNTKIPLLKKLSKKADKVLVGGVLANNFLASQGFEIGKSISHEKNIKLAKKIFSNKIVYPVDVIVSPDKNFVKYQVKKIEKVGKMDTILDIGPETMKIYAKYIKKAETLIWNGPMGMFENEKYKHGTLFIGRSVASRAKGKAFGLVGGGETVQALRLTKMFSYLDWVSTGGGAILTYLSGDKLPGLSKIVK